MVDSDRLGKTAISIPSERPKGLGNPCLVVIAGPSLGHQYDLSDAIVDIGRQEECVISVPSSKVSRRHASVQRVLGRYTVTDLGSTNGTFLNGRKLDKAEVLKDGDKIQVGELVLKYMESRLELHYHQQILSLATTDALTGAQNKRSATTDTAPESCRPSGTSAGHSQRLSKLEIQCLGNSFMPVFGP